MGKYLIGFLFFLLIVSGGKALWISRKGIEKKEVIPVLSSPTSSTHSLEERPASNASPSTSPSFFERAEALLKKSLDLKDLETRFLDLLKEDEKKMVDWASQQITALKVDPKTALFLIRSIFRFAEKPLVLAQNIFQMQAPPKEGGDEHHSGPETYVSVVKTYVFDLLFNREGTPLFSSEERASLIDTVFRMASHEKNLAIVRSALQWLKAESPEKFKESLLARSQEERVFLADI